MYTLDEALDYLYSFINLENKLDQRVARNEYNLDNMKRLAALFGHPEDGEKIIHVAGTKGKGSTVYFLTAMLVRCGFHVASFMSPHLERPNERILFDQEPIGDDEFLQLINDVKKKLDDSSVRPTTFELFFLIYLLYGKQKKADYFVIETGLGGRLDCTNIVTPLASVITTIGYDHTNILGETLEKITSEKAGIIKKGAIVVLGPQIYRCRSFVKKKAKEESAFFYDVSKICKLLKSRCLEDGVRFSFRFYKKKILDFFLPLLGIHQMDNFFTALTTLYLIYPEIFFILNKEKTLPVSLPGRMEVLESQAPIILDVAHNQESAMKLVRSLKKHFPGKKWTILTAMASDKDYNKFFKEIKKIACKVIVTSTSDFKESYPDKIYSYITQLKIPAHLEVDQDKAAELFLKEKGPRLITGSFYVAGPFLKNWRRERLLKNNR